MDALGDTIAEVAAADPNARLNILAGNGSRTARHHMGRHAVRAAARRRRGAGQRTVRRRRGLAGDPRPPPRHGRRLRRGDDRAERIGMTLSLSNHLAADSAARALRRDVYDGLTQTPKSLPPKWFYDSVGSDLFDQITRLPEYYPTRAEAEILRDRAAEIAAASGADTLVELGSGTSEKTRLLLSALRDTRIAAPVHPVRRRRRGAAGRQLGHPRRVPGHRDRRCMRRFRGAPRQDPAGRQAAGGVPRLDDRQPHARTAGRVPVGAVRHVAAGRHPAAGHRPGQGHRPAGARLRRQRRRDGAVQPQCARGGEPGTRRRLRPRGVRARRPVERRRGAHRDVAAGTHARSGCGSRRWI